MPKVTRRTQKRREHQEDALNALWRQPGGALVVECIMYGLGKMRSLLHTKEEILCTRLFPEVPWLQPATRVWMEDDDNKAAFGMDVLLSRRFVPLHVLLSVKIQLLLARRCVVYCSPHRFS